jgi:hypothetical protein
MSMRQLVSFSWSVGLASNIWTLHYGNKYFVKYVQHLSKVKTNKLLMNCPEIILKIPMD